MGRTICEALKTATRPVKDVVDSIPRTLARGVEEIRNLNNALGEGNLSWSNILKASQRHKLGLAACIESLCHVDSGKRILSEIVKMCSLLEMEQTLVNTVMHKITSLGVDALPRGELLRDQNLLDEVAELANNPAKGQQLFGLAGVAASIGGIDVCGLGPIESFAKAERSAKALEDLWARVEKYLNTLGIINTGKWALVKEYSELSKAIEPTFEWVNKTIAARPAEFIKPDNFDKFNKLGKDIKYLEQRLRENTHDEIRKGKLFLASQAMKVKWDSWQQEIHRVRSCNGIRPVPVAFAIYSRESQIGKSYLFQEIVRRVVEGLHAQYVSDPEKWAGFGNVRNWTTWNINVRDEYDQNYFGQEVFYCDDAFAVKDNSDHAMWLTFIAGETLGTKQAGLEQKGMAFSARFGGVSCNVLPRNSMAISNIYAVQNRFDCILVDKIGPVPKAGDEYDPDFKHLKFHVGPMPTHCSLHGDKCTTSCTANNMTLQEIADRYVAQMMDREESFQTRLNSLTLSSPLNEEMGEDDSDEEAIFTESDNGSDIPDSEWNSSISTDEISMNSDTAGIFQQVMEEDRGVITKIKMKPVAVRNVSETVQESNFIRFALHAYTSPVCERAADPRIVNWARFLRKTRTKQTFLDWLKDDEEALAYEFLLILGLFEVIPGKEKEFAWTIWESGETPIRVVDRVTTTYLWSPRLNEGTRLWFVPSIETDVLDETTARDEARMVFRALGISQMEFEGVNLSNRFTCWRIAHKSVKHERSARLMYVITSIGGWIVCSPLTTLVSLLTDRKRADILQDLQRPLGLRPCPNLMAYTKSAPRYLKPLGVLADAALALPKVITAGFKWARDMCDVACDFVLYSLCKISEFFGCSIHESVQSVLDAIAEFTASKLALLVIPMIAGLVIAFYKWITKPKLSNQGYDKLAPKQPKQVAKMVKKMPLTSQHLEKKEGILDALPKPVEDQDCAVCSLEALPKDNESWEVGKFKVLSWDKEHEFYTATNVKHEDVALQEWAIVLDDLDDMLETDFEYRICQEDTKEVHPYLVLYPEDGLTLHNNNPVSNLEIKNLKGFEHLGTKFLSFEMRFLFKDKEDVLKRIQNFLSDQKVTEYLLIGTKVGQITEVEVFIREIDGQSLTKRAQTAVRKAFNIFAGKAGDCVSFADILRDEGKDDVAMTLLDSLVRKHQVWISAPKKGDKFEDPETSNGCAGLANGEYVIFPNHMAMVNNLVKVYYFGKESYASFKADRRNRNYMVAKVIHENKLGDTAVAKFISPSEAKELLGETLGLCSKVVPYPTGLEKHVMPGDQLAKLLVRGVETLQYLPCSGMVIPCTSKYQGVTKRLYVDGVREVDLISVVGSTTAFAYSQPGDCGGPLFVGNSKIPKKLIGFHVAGSDMNCCAALLNKELFDLISTSYVEEMKHVKSPHIDVASLMKVGGVGSEMMEDWPETVWNREDPFWKLMSPGMGPDVPYGEDVAALGTLCNPVLPSAQHKSSSEWVKSPFYGAFEIQLVPPALTANDPRIEVDLPRNRNGEKSLLLTPNNQYGVHMPELNAEICDVIYSQTLEYYKVVFANKPIGCGNMSAEELIEYSINGDPTCKFMTGMETKTSPGFPFGTLPGISKKSDLIEVTDEGKRRFRDTLEARTLYKRCKETLELANKGVRNLSFCSSKLKDQLIKVEHVKRGKTRVFNCSSIEDVIVSNALNGKFKEEYQKLRFEMNHAIGINVHSHEWEEVFNYLNVFSNWLDVDFANFDKHLHSLLCRMSEKLVVDTIAACDPDSWERARYVEGDKAVNSVMVDNASVYITEHGNKSGEARTTPRNSQVNFFMMFYVWIVVTEESDIRKFLDNVRFLTYGDDIVMTVSDKYKDIYHFNAIKTVLNGVGQEVTPSKKVAGEAPNFSSLEDITFLKRYFRPLGLKVVAPIVPRSIEGLFGYTKIDSCETTIWQLNVRTQLVEAFLWGQEYYENFVRRLQERVKAPGFPENLVVPLALELAVGFEEQKRKYLKGLGCFIEEMEDETAIGRLIRANRSTLYSELDNLDITHVAADVAELKGTLEDLVRKVNSIDSRVTQTETAYVNIGQRLDIVDGRVTVIQGQVSSLITQTEELTRAVAEAEDLARQAMEEAEEANNVASAARDTVSELEAEIQGLSDSFIGLEAQVNSALQSFQSSLDDMQAAIATAVKSGDRVMIGQNVVTQIEATKRIGLGFTPNVNVPTFPTKQVRWNVTTDPTENFPAQWYVKRGDGFYPQDSADFDSVDMVTNVITTSAVVNGILQKYP